MERSDDAPPCRWPAAGSDMIDLFFARNTGTRPNFWECSLVRIAERKWAPPLKGAFVGMRGKRGCSASSDDLEQAGFAAAVDLNAAGGRHSFNDPIDRHS